MSRHGAPARRLILVLLALLSAGLPVRADQASAFALTDTPPSRRLAMNLDLLPATPFLTVGYGTQSYNTLAAAALDLWNQVGIGVIPDRAFFSVRSPETVGDQCRRDGINEVRFAFTVCGMDWEDALGLTFTRSLNGRVVEADVLFNASILWDAFPGPFVTVRGGLTLRDFFRVATHEFGHAAGLDHPDEAGQTVPALLNSHISDIDSVRADDISGAHSIFWGPPCAGDGSGPVDSAKLTAFVTSLYQTVLGRTPGPPEVTGWVSYLAANPHVAGVDVVLRDFFDSAEYRGRPLTPWLHVFLLYRAVLGRDPDAAGQAAWVGALLARTNTILPFFVSSAEFRNLVTTLRDPVVLSAAIRRLYAEALGRDASAEEVAAGVEAVLATGDFTGVAVTVFNLVEYLAVPRTPAQHVVVLYRALLARAPTDAEVAAWVGFLGAQLAPITDAFAGSAEFQARCPGLFQ